MCDRQRKSTCPEGNDVVASGLGVNRTIFLTVSLQIRFFAVAVADASLGIAGIQLNISERTGSHLTSHWFYRVSASCNSFFIPVQLLREDSSGEPPPFQWVYRLTAKW